MEENKPKRPRRTRAEIEAKVFDAIRQLADTKGLSNINFADICQYADVQPIVLNRNYETMEKLLDKYAYTCDYWLHDLFNSQHPTDQAGKDILKNTLQALAGHLYDNPDMQRLLTWELSADNEITRRMARSREMYYKAAIEEYNRMFANTDIPIDTITLQHIDEENIGKLIFYYELLTSLVGQMMNVNTYDQPGVESGKKILEGKLIEEKKSFPKKGK